MINHDIEKYKGQGAKMAKYLNLLTEFGAVKIEQVRRDLNSHADTLAGLASIFEGKIGWTIAVDLISALSHEMS